MGETLIECLTLVQNGTPGAFAQLAEQYQPLVLSLVESFLRSMPADTLGRDDLIQEANIALYRAAVKFDTTQDKVTFGLFAKVCIHNRLVSTLRRQRRLAKKAHLTPAPVRDTSLELQTLKDSLDGVLTHYEERVLSLRIKNYSYKEIAEKLNTDPKSVDNALCRIRKKVREIKKRSD